MACCHNNAFIAAKKGHLDCLRYAHENVWSPLNEKICLTAAENGHLDCLRYAHENGAPWDKNTCSCAAQNGHLDCLRYAHENGAPLNEKICSSATMYGHLKCLLYAYEICAPWDDSVCKFAAIAALGHIACLRYAFLVGAPWPEAPPEMIAWRDRIRKTAAKILKTHHALRVRSANTIKYAWLEYFYRPESSGSMFAKAHFEHIHDASNNYNDPLTLNCLGSV